jgi:CO dehydrogenase/acetyl-CoA synthase beta subunit
MIVVADSLAILIIVLFTMNSSSQAKNLFLKQHAAALAASHQEEEEEEDEEEEEERKHILVHVSDYYCTIVYMRPMTLIWCVTDEHRATRRQPGPFLW